MTPQEAAAVRAIALAGMAECSYATLRDLRRAFDLRRELVDDPHQSSFLGVNLVATNSIPDGWLQAPTGELLNIEVLK